jgi:hypothetical protein
MTMNAIPIDRAQGDVSADELCARLGIGRDALVSSLRELELAGFIVNLTPHLPPLKSSWRITFLSFRGDSPTKDYERPEVIERIQTHRAARRANYRRVANAK